MNRPVGRPGVGFPAADRVSVHGQRARGGHDRGDHGRRRRLVHGAAPRELRRSHAVDDGVPRRERGAAARAAAAAGYFTFCGASALVTGARRSPAPPQAQARRPAPPRRGIRRRGRGAGVRLGCGFLFLSLYQGVLASLGEPAVRGLPRDHSRAGADAGDRCRARARLFCGWPAGRCCSPRSTRRWPGPAACRCAALSRCAFLLVLGLAVAATAQITGVLLVFALLVAPAATARADHPADRRRPRAERAPGAARSPGSGSRSPTSPTTRSGSTSRASRSSLPPT